MGGQKTGVGGTFSYLCELSDLPADQPLVYQIHDLRHNLSSEVMSFQVQPEAPLVFDLSATFKSGRNI